MNPSAWLDTTFGMIAESLPSIVGALVILIAGWLVAVVVRAVIRKSLGLVKLNQRLQGKMDLEGGLATGAFYLVLVMALIAFFNVLNLPLVSEPLQSLVNQVVGFLPKLIGAGVLALVAWILATVVQKAATTALAATKLDDKLSAQAGMKPMSETLGGVLYAFVILLFLPAILGALELQGLLAPVQDMVGSILGMLPNIIGAAVLGLVGWFVAKILGDLVSNLAAAAGADKLGETAGLKGTMPLSKLVGMIVFVFVFVPALIAALDALKIAAISEPATQMLGQLMAAVPNLFAAALIIGVAVFLARFVSGIVSNLLGGIGFDQIPAKLGLQSSPASTGTPATGTPSKFIGNVVAFFILLFASMEAASVIGFSQLSDIAGMLGQFAGQVAMGVAIIGIGLWLANLVHAAILRMDRPSAALMAGFVRVTILGLVFAMGLQSMGIADTIVNLAFALTLGAVAVAAALAFGLGGREAAGKQLEHWFSNMRKGRQTGSA